MSVTGSMVQMAQAAQEPTPAREGLRAMILRNEAQYPPRAVHSMVCRSKTVDVTLTNVILEDPQGDIVARIECRDRWSTVYIHKDAWIEARHYTRQC